MDEEEKENVTRNRRKVGNLSKLSNSSIQSHETKRKKGISFKNEHKWNSNQFKCPNCFVELNPQKIRKIYRFTSGEVVYKCLTCYVNFTRKSDEIQPVTIQKIVNKVENKIELNRVDEREKESKTKHIEPISTMDVKSFIDLTDWLKNELKIPPDLLDRAEELIKDCQTQFTSIPPKTLFESCLYLATEEKGNAAIQKIIADNIQINAFFTIQISNFLRKSRSTKKSKPKYVSQYWIEKIIVTGQYTRESGEYAFTKALWSPQTDRRGNDIYKNMRKVKKGDVILHLIDNKAFVGISKVAKEYDSSFKVLPGNWDDGTGKRRGYLIKLEEYSQLRKPILREEILKNRYKRRLQKINNQSEVFYTRHLTLRQGAYLTPVSNQLLNLLNDVYKEKTGNALPYFHQDTPSTSVINESKSEEKYAPISQRKSVDFPKRKGLLRNGLNFEEQVDSSQHVMDRHENEREITLPIEEEQKKKRRQFKCPLCGIELKNLMRHLTVQHNIRSMDELREKIKHIKKEDQVRKEANQYKKKIQRSSYETKPDEYARTFLGSKGLSAMLKHVVESGTCHICHQTVRSEFDYLKHVSTDCPTFQQRVRRFSKTELRTIQNMKQRYQPTMKKDRYEAPEFSKSPKLSQNEQFYLEVNYPPSTENVTTLLKGKFQTHIVEGVCNYVPVLFCTLVLKSNTYHPYLLEPIDIWFKVHDSYIVPLHKEKLDLLYIQKNLKFEPRDIGTSVKDFLSNMCYPSHTEVPYFKNLITPSKLKTIPSIMTTQQVKSRLLQLHESDPSVKREVVEKVQEKISLELDAAIGRANPPFEAKKNKILEKINKMDHRIENYRNKLRLYQSEMNQLIKQKRKRETWMGGPLYKITQGINWRQKLITKRKLNIAKLEPKLKELETEKDTIDKSWENKRSRITNRYKQIKEDITNKIRIKFVFVEVSELFIPIIEAQVELSTKSLKRNVQLSWNGYNKSIINISDSQCTTCQSSLELTDSITFCSECLQPLCTQHILTCMDCEKIVCSDHSWTCTTCDHLLCNTETQFKCTECGNLSCGNCVKTCKICKSHLCSDHIQTCSLCNETVCPEHTVTCTICGKQFCTKEEMKTCSICGQTTCLGCLKTCESCGENVCANHTWSCSECKKTLCVKEEQFKCSECGSLLCSECKPTCHVCGENFCSSHINTCKVCSKKICQLHSVDCRECGEIVCNSRKPDELSHFKRCSICENIHCNDCIHICEGCENTICSEDIVQCPNCGKKICKDCVRIEKKFFGLSTKEKCKVCIN